MSKKLSIIIPFLNEGDEVENTIRNILDFSDNCIEIILINDASDDEYDYQSIAETYKVTYIVNTNRLGVAASRDLGVKISKAPFFILLDAHMRFYDNHWVKRIINELTIDEKCLLCCQTRALEKKDGRLITLYDNETSYGAYIDLADKNSILDVKWSYIERTEHFANNNMFIPCVLGAAYACSKKFWLYLKGLEGLIYYGSDEAFISLKVWLAGGTCKLLTDVVVGHIYRNNEAPAPYQNNYKHFIYNKLVISETLLPEKIRKKIKYYLKVTYPRENIIQSEYLLYKNRLVIDNLEKYFNINFNSENYGVFEQINSKNTNYDRGNIDIIVLEILNILQHRVDLHLEIGISKGLMGIIIFYYNYARFIQNKEFSLKADNLLEILVANIETDLYYGFSTGICGIGWGLSYLCQNEFIEFDVEEIFIYIDKIVMEIDPSRIVNFNFDNGLGGVVRYVLSRIYLSKVSKKNNPFDEDFLFKINDRIKSTLAPEKSISETCDSISTYIEFLDFYEQKKDVMPPTLYDVYSIYNINDTDLKSMNSGLYGLSGLALNLLNCS